jgi:hypothetical protein
MPAQESQVLPVFGGMQLEPAKQQNVEFDGLINCDLANGVLEARRGWRILQTPATWNETGSGYVPATYKTLAFEDTLPAGSFIFSSRNGSEYLITTSRANTSTSAPSVAAFATVYTTTGHTVTASTALRGDPPDRPYVFSVFGSAVYFTNGGRIWRWASWTLKVEDVSETFYANPADQNQNAYITKMHGASIVVEHNGRNVYAGFGDDVWMTCSLPVDTDSGDNPATKDVDKDGLVVSGDGLSIRAFAGMLFYSDFALPRSVRIKYHAAMPSLRKITGLASFRKQLIVFTDTEMWVMRVNPGQSSVSKLMGVGCAAHRTIQQTRDGMLMWTAQDGVYGWNGSGLPKRVSAPIDQIFKNEDANMGYPRTNRPDNHDTHVPYIVAHNLLYQASAAVLASQDLYCVALKAGSAIETNDVILCVHYPSGRLWWWCSGTISRGGSEASPTNVVASAMAGHYTLMSSAIEPGKLFSQAYHFYNAITENDDPKNRATHMAIAVMDRPSIGDQKLTYAGGNPTIVDHPFEMIAISRRFHIGTAVPKLYRQVRLRMYAKRRQDFGVGTIGGASADTNKFFLTFIPELAPFENVNQRIPATASAAREYSTEVEPWPEEYSNNVNATYFWQQDGGAVALGKWQSDAAGADTMYHNWVPYQPFDKRVDIRSPSTQFARVALRKRVDAQSGASVRIINMSLVVMIEKGVTR